MDRRIIIGGGGAESEEILPGLMHVEKVHNLQNTSAVFGTLSQKTSIFRSPRSVCSCVAVVNGVDQVALQAILPLQTLYVLEQPQQALQQVLG